MNSQALGKSISEVEVTNISNHGIWLLTEEKNFLYPMSNFHGSRMLRWEKYLRGVSTRLS